MRYDDDAQERVLEFLGGLPCATEKGIEFEFEDVIGTNETVYQDLVMRKRGGVPMVKSANKC